MTAADLVASLRAIVAEGRRDPMSARSVVDWCADLERLVDRFEGRVEIRRSPSAWQESVCRTVADRASDAVPGLIRVEFGASGLGAIVTLVSEDWYLQVGVAGVETYRCAASSDPGAALAEVVIARAKEHLP